MCSYYWPSPTVDPGPWGPNPAGLDAGVVVSAGIVLCPFVAASSKQATNKMTILSKDIFKSYLYNLLFYIYISLYLLIYSLWSISQMDGVASADLPLYMTD